MAEHPGASPYNPATPVGMLRVLVGDSASVPLAPPVTGQASYAVWSDADLQAALTAAGESTYRAAGALYLQLAAQYAQDGVSIKTDDLSIDNSKRGGSFTEIAKSFFDLADGEDATAGADFFQIVPFSGRPDDEYFPRVEGSPWPIFPGPTPEPTPDEDLVPDPSNPGYWTTP